MSKAPKIVSIGFAVPNFSYSQREIFDELKYSEHFWMIFANSHIDKRHFIVPLEKIGKLSWQEQQEAYLKCALDLSKRAVLSCLDNRSPKDINSLTFSSCTGILPGPVMGHYLAREFNFSPNTYITNIAFQGCNGGFPGLKSGLNSTYATGKNSLVIACEACSCVYFPEPEGKPDPENAYELARGYSLFADACSCILIGFDNDPRHPTIVDTHTYFNTEYMDDLGYIWRNGRLRLRLSRRVPDIAASLAKTVTEEILKRNNLKIGDINYWIIHPAASVVLDKIRDNLGLPEEKMYYSREVLRSYGNCSSATVGIIGKLLMQKESSPEGYLVVISLGPGMTGDATLLKFG